ncbi:MULTISPECIES: protein phosphatase 2C domain-containing protein [unclassified Streptomyces]|uniref:protein phosphatase 2C domain-containing protein n=1 Tax=unclassified Streptomyces TaxID=2593676 RepID=UPI003818A802
MSQQGGRPTGTGHEDDWWGQLYGDDDPADGGTRSGRGTGDTGPTASGDSLDDRFASAAGAVRPTGPPGPPGGDPGPAARPWESEDRPSADTVGVGEPRDAGREEDAGDVEWWERPGPARGAVPPPGGVPRARRPESVRPDAADPVRPDAADSVRPAVGGATARPADSDGLDTSADSGLVSGSGTWPVPGASGASGAPGGERREEPVVPAEPESPAEPGVRADSAPPAEPPTPAPPVSPASPLEPPTPPRPTPPRPEAAATGQDEAPPYAPRTPSAAHPWDAVRDTPPPAPPVPPPPPASPVQAAPPDPRTVPPAAPPRAPVADGAPPPGPPVGPTRSASGAFPGLSAPPSGAGDDPGVPAAADPPPAPPRASVPPPAPTASQPSATPRPPAVPPQPPARPTTPAHLGSGPPTYDAEPTALPAADPDALDGLVADTVLDGARYGTCTLRAASVRGDSARYRGEPRRDALLTARFGHGDDALVLVAMATGARAAQGAHRAAAEVLQSIGRAVGRSHARLAEDIRAARRGDLKSGLHRLTDRSLGRLRASAAEQGLAPDEYAAGLRCLLLPADPACRTRVFFGVGPGGLFRLRDGAWQDLEPQPGEVTGEPVLGFGGPPAATPRGDRLTLDLGIPTPPSPYEPAPGPPPEPFRFRASVARPGDTLLLCTGGLADPFRGEPDLAAHLLRRWSAPAPPGLTAFLADTQIRVKGYADDRTAAAVWEA